MTSNDMKYTGNGDQTVYVRADLCAAPTDNEATRSSKYLSARIMGIEKRICSALGIEWNYDNDVDDLLDALDARMKAPTDNAEALEALDRLTQNNASIYALQGFSYSRKDDIQSVRSALLRGAGEKWQSLIPKSGEMALGYTTEKHWHCVWTPNDFKASDTLHGYGETPEKAIIDCFRHAPPTNEAEGQ